MDEEKKQTPPEGDGPKPQKKGADAPASPQSTLIDEVVESKVEKKEAVREKNDMAAQLEELKKKNKELEDGAAAGKAALETLSAQEKEEITGLRGDLEKALGPEAVKVVYPDGIPEDLSPCALKEKLALATHGVVEPKGEAEEETGVNGTLNILPKGEAGKKKDKPKPSKLRDKVPYSEPIPPGRGKPPAQ